MKRPRSIRVHGVLSVLLLAVASGANAQAPDWARGGLRRWTDPPYVSLEAAQPQLTFRLYVPRAIPAGGRLEGVSVYRVRVRGRAALTAQAKQARADRRPFTGFGVLFVPRGTSIQVRAVQGSPAERAGLSSSHLAGLLALNGRPLPANRVATWKRVNAASRGAGPLALTIQEPRAGRRTVTVPTRRTFLVGAEAPSIPHGRRAALIYRVRGGPLALFESLRADRTAPTAAGQSVRIAGHMVMLTGPAQAPTASWTQGDVDLLLDNASGALTRAEVLRFVASAVPAGQP